MKKQLILLCLPLSLLLLSSCGNNEANQGDADMAKTLAIAMSKGQEAYNGMVFNTKFDQRFKVFYESESEYQSSVYSRDYSAQGELTIGFAINDNNLREFDLGKLYKNGSAYFEGAQKEISKFSHRINEKLGFDKGDKAFSEDYSYHHLFGIQFNAEEVKARANDNMVDNIDSSNNHADVFNGKIAKDIVKEVSGETIQNAFGRIFYLDAWDNVARFRDGLTAYFQNLSLDTLEKGASFIRENNVSFKKSDKGLEASFSINGKDIFASSPNMASKTSKSISCSVIINEDKAILSQYDYDFKDVFAEMLESEKEGMMRFESSVEAFTLKGKISDIPYAQLNLDGTFEEYDQEHSEEFMQGFLDHVIPHPIKS